MKKIKLFLLSFLILLSALSFSQNVLPVKTDSISKPFTMSSKEYDNVNLRLDNYRKTYYNGLKVVLFGGVVSGLGTLVFINGVRNEFKEARNLGGGLIVHWRSCINCWILYKYISSKSFKIKYQI